MDIQYSRFDELPFQEFEKMDYSIYVLDFNWNYLFVNSFVYKNLKISETLLGENMWKKFPVLEIAPDFKRMKKNMELKKKTNLITLSPLTGRRISIVGYALEDCYFFSCPIMMDKDSLITDLRSQLDKGAV